MTLVEAVEDFLAQKRVAVIGVSRDRRQAANAIFRKLRDAAGREVIPVNRRATEVENMRCYPDLKSIPGSVDAAVLATPAAEMEGLVRACAAAGIRRVWLHLPLGGRGAEAAIEAARELKLTLIPGGCPMMFCAPVDPAHRCFRWMLKLVGRLPEPVG